MEMLSRIMNSLILFGVFIGLSAVPLAVWFYGWLTNSDGWEAIGIWSFLGLCALMGVFFQKAASK